MATVSRSLSTVERALRRFRRDPRLTDQIRTALRRMAQASPVELDDATWQRTIASVLGGVS